MCVHTLDVAIELLAEEWPPCSDESSGVEDPSFVNVLPARIVFHGQLTIMIQMSIESLHKATRNDAMHYAMKDIDV
jgi:hypothetical protein